VLPADGPLGVLLASLFGYNDAPVLGEVIVYLGFLIPALFLFLKPARGPEGRALSKT
jgi:high-affinity iron transporter